MSLNLPAPIDQALLNQRVQEWAEAITASFLARYPFRPGIDARPGEPDTRCVVSVDILRRYWRIVISNHGSRHVHAFVDPATGDVFKAAGWKAPAKGVRYNLVDDASYQAMLARCESSGGYLYR